MVKRQAKSKPTWTDVKAKLEGFDRAGLLGLIKDLHDADKDNQTFLHTRFGLGGDVLEPYKKTIDRWVNPDAYRNEETSVSKAKRAISDYRKAIDDPAGLAELMVFYCEQATEFASEFGYDDGAYYDALGGVFEQALTVAKTLPAKSRDSLIARLEVVRDICQDFGYGVGDYMVSVFTSA
jgi:hypothetical protein